MRFQRHPALVVLAVLFALVLSVSLRGVALAAPAHSDVTCRPGACQGTYYGADIGSMQVATNDWPQKYSNWCGIANVQAIMRYAWYVDTGQQYPLNWAEGSIHDQMNGLLGNNPVSKWGTPGGNSYVQANLSQDFGTDPRAIAWAAWLVTPNGYYYHNYTYEVSSNSSTYNMALDFGPWNGTNHPISATVFHGGHSVVVSGVYAASDPSHYNTTVYGIYTWDPGVGYNGGNIGVNSTMDEVWSLTDWTTNSNLFSAYSSNGGNDPDPSTPTNYYNPPVPLHSGRTSHWIGFWVTIEQDFVQVCSSYGPNYSLNQNGAPSAHNGTC